MKIILFGGSGLIGTQLQMEWKEKFELKVGTRNRASKEPNKFHWDPMGGVLEAKELEGADVVINLAGENISSGRWTEEKKKRILESRVKSAALLAKTLAGMENPPKLWIQASAIGYYGSHGDDVLDEKSKRGSGFLASVCKQWEEACQPAEGKTRIVFARFGVVLSDQGGALQKMLQPFKLGLGGKIGSGKQWMSWVDNEEIAPIFEHIMNHGEIKGPVNVVSDIPVQNSDFTKKLGKALKRPTFFPMPAPAAKAMLGEMAEELILSSVRVNPKVLLDSGYKFKYSPLEVALKRIIK